MARNGALCPTSRNSERETRLVGCGCSPDRTSLQLKFPANREKYREFVDCGAFWRSERRVSERNQWLAAKFPTQRNREHFIGAGTFLEPIRDFAKLAGALFLELDGDPLSQRHAIQETLT
jgi:hypothetical protein